MGVQTTLPLAKGAEWASPWVPSRFWDGTIVGTFFADQPGTLHVEQSSDGVNIDVNETFDVEADNGEGFYRPSVGAFWRLRFVNDNVAAQTVLRVGAQTRGGR